MRINGGLLWRSALLGQATGSRSMLGLAAVALIPPVSGSGPLGRPWVRVGIGLAAAGELVGDKLPKTPSRLEPPGIGARVVLGGVAAAALAYRDAAHSGGLGATASGPMRAELIQAVAVGAACATLSCFVGARWRGFAAQKFGRDLPGALIEDGLALAEAAVAVRGGRS